MLQAATHIVDLPYGTTPEIEGRLACRYAPGFFQYAREVVLADPANWLGPANWTLVRDQADKIHAAGHGGTRVGYYAGGLANVEVHRPAFEILAEEDILHKPDGTKIGQAPHQTPAEGGSRRLWLVNLSRKATRDKLIDYWSAWMATNHVQALLFDSFEPDYYAIGLAAEIGYSAALEGAVTSTAWWAGCLRDFVRDLRWRLESEGREVWVNAINLDRHYVPVPSDGADAIMGQYGVNTLDYASGALYEHFHRVILSTAWLEKLVALATLAAPKRRPIFYSLNWDFLPLTDPGYVYTYNDAMRQFYIGAYLLVADPPYTRFGYSPWGFTPGPPAAPFLPAEPSEWGLQLGPARGPVQWNTTGPGKVAWREYDKAYVLVNASPDFGRWNILGSYRVWHPLADIGVVITPADTPGMNVAGKSALCLFKAS